MNNNIIITGIPRSGTTLTCHLLNKLPDVVALHEPINFQDAASAGNHDVEKLVTSFFKRSRESLLLNGIAISKQHQGKVPDNPKSKDSGWMKTLQRFGVSRMALEKIRLGTFGLRQSIVESGHVKFDKPLHDDFTLCIKHNGQFTSLLPSLLSEYDVFAIIRNPLAVLCSWNSIRFGPREGHMYSTEKINPQLAERLSKYDDRYQRQLVLLSWFYEQYAQYLESEQVIRYEDIIQSKGQVLSACAEAAKTLNESLENNNLAYSDRQLNAVLSEQLLASDGAYWQFYSRESVAELAEKIS